MQLVYSNTKLPACVAQQGDIVAVNSNKNNQWIRGKILNWDKVSFYVWNKLT
jgi:hypothetical protein